MAFLKKSRGSLGNRKAAKRFCKESYQIGCYIVRKVMHSLTFESNSAFDLQSSNRGQSINTHTNILSHNYNPPACQLDLGWRYELFKNG